MGIKPSHGKVGLINSLFVCIAYRKCVGEMRINYTVELVTPR